MAEGVYQVCERIPRRELLRGRDETISLAGMVRTRQCEALAMQLVCELKPRCPVAVELFEDFRDDLRNDCLEVRRSLNIRRVRTVDVQMMRPDRLMKPHVIHAPPKPIGTRIKDWFKRTWDEVQRYDGPTGHEPRE